MNVPVAVDVVGGTAEVALLDDTFERARNTVISSLNIREVGLFAGLVTRNLSHQECKVLVTVLCSTVSSLDKRSWSSSTVTGTRYMGEFIYYRN